MQKENRNQPVARHGMCGAVIVEAAVLLPALVVMFLLCWDTFAVVFSDLRHRSAMVQLALNFRVTPIKAKVTFDPTTLVPEIEYTPRTGNELFGTDDSFLDRFNALFIQIMDNAGTGTDYMDYNIMSRLVIYEIREQDDAVNGYVGGTAYNSFVADKIGGYTAPGKAGNPNSCFGDDLKSYEDLLNTYESEKSAMVLSPGAGAPTRPEAGSPLARFGTKLFDVQTEMDNPYIPDLPIYQISMGDVELFLRYRAVVYYLMCSVPPRFFGGDPVITKGLFMVDKEVSLE